MVFETARTTHRRIGDADAPAGADPGHEIQRVAEAAPDWQPRQRFAVERRSDGSARGVHGDSSRHHLNRLLDTPYLHGQRDVDRLPQPNLHGRSIERDESLEVNV